MTDPGVFGQFDLGALVQPHLQVLFVCLGSCMLLYSNTQVSKKPDAHIWFCMLTRGVCFESSKSRVGRGKYQQLSLEAEVI